LESIAASSGKDSIAVSKFQRGFGYFAKAAAKETKKDFHVIRFCDIISAMRYCLSDRFFAVGEHIIERTTGHPMGGSFSEPATLVDLGRSIANFYASAEIQKEAEVFLPDVPAEAHLQGLLHVDDCLLSSHIWCCKCIVRALSRIWPRDVGTSLEMEGDTIDFLTVTLHIDPNGTFRIVPLVKNRLFALGFQVFPDVARIPPYRGPAYHSKQDLRLFLFPHILTFNRIAIGFIGPAAHAVALLIAETARLGWPFSIISSTLLGLPNAHETSFVLSVRCLAKQMRRENPREVYEYCRSFYRRYVQAKSRQQHIFNDPTFGSTP
jgi:hypothetical protein